MADPRTIIVPLTSPGQTATYRLAPGVTQYIQSVVATVDTSASGDVTPVLTISEQSGVVVGDKQQQNAIAGGGSGRATWALGLADESAGGPVSGFIRYDVNNVGDWLEIEADGRLPNPETIGFDVPVGQFNIRITDTTFGQFLVNAPFFHFETAGNDFRLFNDGTAQWDAANIAFDTSAGQLFEDDGTVGIDIQANSGPLELEGFPVTVNSTSSTLPATYDSNGGHVFHNVTTKVWRVFNQTLVAGVVPVLVVNGPSVSANVFQVQLRTGQTMQVLNDTGAVIFQVDESGQLHGKTGSTLTFDL